MERLCNLLFELSNEDRLKILLGLQERAMRLTHLSEQLNLTVQETSRHLSRLSDAKLIKKDVDGLYRSTPYGEHSMKLLSGFRFLSQHREYFTTHTTSHLPHEFVSRIGDLVNCTFEDDVMVAFHGVEHMIQEAQEHVWILSDQILMSTQPFLVKAVKRGVEFRLILPEDMTPPQGFKPTLTITKRGKMRTLKRVDVGLATSEKEGVVAFPTTDGRMDYLGFGLTDERSHKWCRDLFLYYWEKGKRGKPKGYPSP